MPVCLSKTDGFGLMSVKFGEDLHVFIQYEKAAFKNVAVTLLFGNPFACSIAQL